MKGVQVAIQRFFFFLGRGGGGTCIYDQLNMRERMAKVSAFCMAFVNKLRRKKSRPWPGKENVMCLRKEE